MMKTVFHLFCAGALCLAVTHGAEAQQGGSIVDAIVTALDQGPTTRSVNNPATAMLSADQFIPPNYDLPAHTIYVQFEPGGHMIAYEGMSALRSIAAAMLDPDLGDFTFQVGAHMPAANDALPISSRRAQIVVDHLVTFYGIPKENLIPMGYGNMKLANPTAPADALNERIEFINVTSLK